MLFTPEDIAVGLLETELREARSEKRTYYDRHHLRKDGTIVRTTSSVAPIRDSRGALIGFAKLVADRSEAYLDREALARREERFRVLIETVPECLIFSLSPDGIITTSNAAARKVLGYSDHEIVGKRFVELFAPEDIENGVPAMILTKAAALGTIGEDRWFVRKDGSRFIGNETVTSLRARPERADGGFVHVAHDLSERIVYLNELRQKLSIDHVTRLPNRSVFDEHLTRAISLMKRRSARLFAVLFIDLDHFKDINDTYGHVAGDRLLEVTARRLERCVRTEDVVARLGGDEFGILLTGIEDSRDASDAADRISAEMRIPITIGTQSVNATVSIGIALGSRRYEHSVMCAAARGRSRSTVSARARSLRCFRDPGSGGFDHPREISVDAGIVGEFRVERRAHHIALAHEDSVAFMLRKHVDARPGALDPRRANEDGGKRRRTQDRNRQRDFGRCDLPPERIAAHGDVDEIERLLIEVRDVVSRDDHAHARSPERHPRMHPRLDRRD